MNAAAANGHDGPSSAERERLFREIADLKAQRNRLMASLAECQREIVRLRTELEGRNK